MEHEWKLYIICALPYNIKEGEGKGWGGGIIQNGNPILFLFNSVGDII
jgi:hypothetical protein